MPLLVQSILNVLEDGSRVDAVRLHLLCLWHRRDGAVPGCIALPSMCQRPNAATGYLPDRRKRLGAVDTGHLQPHAWLINARTGTLRLLRRNPGNGIMSFD